MIPTDGVLQSAQDIEVLDAQTIADDLNTQQSKKFIDPNCHPEGTQPVDISRESFCDSPLENRDQRLADALAKLPKAAPAFNTTDCSQAAVKQLTDLISSMFDYTKLPDQIKQANFMESKIEADLELVSSTVALVSSLNQFKSLPNLVSSVNSLLTTSLAALENITIDDQIVSATLAYSIARVKQLMTLLSDTTADPNLYDILLHTSDFWSYQYVLTERYTAALTPRNQSFTMVDTKLTYTQRVQTNPFGKIYQDASDHLLKSSQPNIDDYYAEVNAGKKAMHDRSWSSITENATPNNGGFGGAIRTYASVIATTDDIENAGDAQNLNKYLTIIIPQLAEFFNVYVTQTPKPPQKSDVLAAISKISFCGQSVPAQLPQNNVSATPNIGDLSAGFDPHNKPTITDLEYWQHYSVYLDIINLLPTYWTIGLYVPTPAGIVKVPLPTVWTPLAVINLPIVGLMVIFLTINGIAISPTVWMLNFPPIPPIPPVPSFPPVPQVPGAPNVTFAKPQLPALPTKPGIGPFNKSGFNKDGFNAAGFNKSGLNSSGFDVNGFNASGFDINGFDKSGFNALGFNSLGFDKNGFNALGFNSAGYNKLGFNKDGFNKDGFNAAGLTKDGKSIAQFTTIPTLPNPSVGLPSTTSIVPKIKPPSLSASSSNSGGSNNSSSLVVMLRSFNKKIKDNTGNEIANVPTVNGVNIDPKLTKSLPFTTDDLPLVKRMGLNNLPYVFYLNQWMQKYITGGGLP